jgi:hypothetical protein
MRHARTAGRAIRPAAAAPATFAGNANLALVGLSSTKVPLRSREAATKPELVVTTG